MSKDTLKEQGFNLLPNWKDALKRYLDELKENVNDSIESLEESKIVEIRGLKENHIKI